VGQDARGRERTAVVATSSLVSRSESWRASGVRVGRYGVGGQALGGGSKLAVEASRKLRQGTKREP